MAKGPGPKKKAKRAEPPPAPEVSEPTEERKRGAATRDPMVQKYRRILQLLAMRDARELSNRDLSEIACVDEATIRRWKTKLGIPQLPKHSGESAGMTEIDEESPIKRALTKKKRGPKPKPRPQ